MSATPEPAIWQEPPRGGFASVSDLSRPGIDRMRSLLYGDTPTPPVGRLTGLSAVEVGVGTATFNLPATPRLQPATGSILGGVMALAADGPLGGALITTLPGHQMLSTSELSMSFLRPAAVGTVLIARARTIRVARALGLSEVFVEDAQGRLLAHGSSRCVFLPAPAGLPGPAAYPEPSGGIPDPYRRPVAGHVMPQEFWDRTPGREVLDRYCAGEMQWPPLAHLTGLRPTACGDGTATCAMPASGWLANYAGNAYGGAIALLADFSLTCAVWTTLEAGQVLGTLDLKVYFLRPVVPDGNDLVARAQVVQRGRTLAVATSRVENADGKPVAARGRRRDKIGLRQFESLAVKPTPQIAALPAWRFHRQTMDPRRRSLADVRGGAPWHAYATSAARARGPRAHLSFSRQNAIPCVSGGPEIA